MEGDTEENDSEALSYPVRLYETISPSSSRSSPERDLISSEWCLKSLFLDNFKSYAGETVIGPLSNHPFLCVVGANGSGKSNFMDAVSFVMGERTANMRVKRMDELIHGALIGKPVAKTAKVSAVFMKKNSGGLGGTEEETTFTRIIRGASCDYQIDSQTVSLKIYLSKLKELGITSKGCRQNFLVFQGAIETIATKDSKERCALIEEISGSSEFKTGYEDAKAALADAEKRQEQAFINKRAVLTEQKSVKMDLVTAQRYQDIVDEFGNKEVEIGLFKLYHNKKDRSKLRNQKLNLADELSNLRDEKKEMEEEEVPFLQKTRALITEMAGKEKELAQVEKEKKVRMPEMITNVEKRKHMEKKLTSAEKSMKHAEEAVLSHQQELNVLRQQLKELEKRKVENVNLYGESETTDGENVNLRESQMLEYFKLKQRAAESATKEMNEMSKLEEECRNTQQVFNSVDRERTSLMNKLELVDKEGRDANKYANTGLRRIQEMQNLLKEKEKQEVDLRDKLDRQQKTVDELTNKLKELYVTIEGSKMSRQEMRRRREKEEVLADLKKRFPGVIGRIGSLVKPIHDKYALAVAKVLMGQEDLIVVNSLETTRRCIDYIKEQMLEPESFLSLNFIKSVPLKTRFRDLKDQNILLVYDVLQFSPEIELAVRHCTRSTVVCPSSRIANMVAAGEFCAQTTDAVTLEGTRYSANGSISGGSADLKKRANAFRGSVDQLEKMEETAQKYENDKREAMSNWRLHNELRDLQAEISGVKMRINYAQKSSNEHMGNYKSKEEEKKAIEKELKETEIRWKKARENLSEIYQKIRQLEGEINTKTDAVFAAFCKQVGIANIRVFEDKDVRAHEERNRERQELDNKIRLVESKISFDADQEDTLKRNVKRWEDTSAELRDKLNTCSKEEKKLKTMVQEIEDRWNKVKGEIEQIKESLKENAKDVEEVREKRVALDKKIGGKQKAISSTNNRMNQLIMKRNDLLKLCKLKGIKLPLIGGRLADATLDDAAMADTDIPDMDLPIQVDFSSLDEDMKKLKTENALKEAEDKLNTELKALEQRMMSFQAPRKNADKKWEAIQKRVRDLEEDFQQSCAATREAKDLFFKVQKQRIQAFMTCFKIVSKNVDAIYKDLTQCVTAQACLDLQNTEEPYLGGVGYNCVAPAKRFMSMDDMSGGEKTLAALALLFAIQSVEPAPFFVLDEIDAALDLKNISKVVSYISRHAKDTQFIVITHKNEFYENAEALLGIAPAIQASECVRSKTFLLDLTKYLD